MGKTRIAGSLALALVASTARAADDKPVAATARYVKIDSAVTHLLAAQIRTIAKDLHTRATETGGKAYLFLEIRQGSSEFGTVRDLALDLINPRISKVTTVAWVPEIVTGNNAILALACEEIVMASKARLGNIARGGDFPNANRRFVVEDIAANKHNRLVSPALVQAMIDAKASLVRAVVSITKDGKTTKESRVVTAKELRELTQDPNVSIEKTDAIKESGEPPIFGGKEAREHDVLAVALVENEAELARRYSVPTESLRPPPKPSESLKPKLIVIDGKFTQVMGSFIGRQIERAESQKASVVILQIETSQGLRNPALEVAHKLVELREAGIRTVAWIPKEAIGPGAIVALGCDEIYVAPKARIGEIFVPDVENANFDGQKLNDLKTDLERLAKAKARPVGVLQAMADPRVKLFRVTNKKDGSAWFMTQDELLNGGDEWEKGPAVAFNAQGDVKQPLILDAQQAHVFKITRATLENRDELKERLNIPAEVTLEPIGQTWVDTLVFWLNHWAGTAVLIVLGVACIYIELHVMSGILGILSALCFSLFFWAKFLGGTAGWLEVILFVLGLACLVVEIFIIPGFGVFGVTGGLLLFTALVMASQTFGQLEPGADMSRLTRNIGTLTVSIFTVLIIGVVLSKFLPNIPFFSRLALAPPSAVVDPNAPQLSPELIEGGLAGLVGRHGVTASVLRPAGKAEIDGDYVDVISDGGYIEAGSTVEVVAVEGNRVVVRDLS